MDPAPLLVEKTSLFLTSSKHGTKTGGMKKITLSDEKQQSKKAS